MDKTIFYLINHGMENSFLNWFMPIITQYKSWIPAGLLFCAYLIRKNPKQGIFLILLMVAVVSLSDFFNYRVLKEIIARVRPCNALPDVHLVAGCPGSFSFPSSHSLNSFALASVIGFYNRRFWLFAAPVAVLVAFSRVYLGVHYPADVAVGAVIGIGIGYAAIRISRIKRIKEKPEKG